MPRLRPLLLRALALLLLAQWAAAFAHCLAPLAAVAARGAHGVEICTADGITTILLGEDGRPAPKPAIHRPACPECGGPAVLEPTPPILVAAPVVWTRAAPACRIAGLPVAPARAPPQQPAPRLSPEHRPYRRRPRRGARPARHVACPPLGAGQRSCSGKPQSHASSRCRAGPCPGVIRGTARSARRRRPRATLRGSVAWNHRRVAAARGHRATRRLPHRPGDRGAAPGASGNPAAVRLVDGRDLANRYAFTLRDVLADTPGVFVQTRYGQELRVSVRGSGIGRGFHLRGVEVLQDGIPVNLADGSGDFYQIDPLAIRSVAVYPGGNGLIFGASSLGGAINIITPTAHTAEAPNILRAAGGSYGTWRLSGQVSRVFGDWDALGSATVLHSDGYRRHSRSQYEQFNANVGYRVAPNVETRFYAGAFIVRQLLPGTLGLSDALERPRTAAPAAVSGNQARNVWAERLANRTTAETGYGRFDFDTWITHKRLYHPIFQVFDQDGLTWGVAPRFTTGFDVAGMRSELVVGARYFAGTNEALQYENLRGSRGRQTLNARQDARNYEAYAENRLWVLPRWALVAGAKMFRDERDYEDRGRGLASSRTYDGFVPRVGVLWQPRPEVQAFANITRSTDVPDFSDLTQTQLGGITGFVPLQAQRAWTAEIGTRGRFERFGWDLALFRSNLRGQLLQFTQVPNSFPASTFNAGLTVNQGVEFAGRVELARNITAADAGDRLTLRQVWTFNDFRFRGDRQYGDNRIAGLPPHVLRTTLTYAQPEGLFITPILDWVPQGAWADYANTLRANAYLTLGLEAGLSVAPGVTVFLDARNLTGKRYVSDLSTITDARRVGSTVFFPGEGRSVYVGARAAF